MEDGKDACGTCLPAEMERLLLSLQACIGRGATQKSPPSDSEMSHLTGRVGHLRVSDEENEGHRILSIGGGDRDRDGDDDTNAQLLLDELKEKIQAQFKFQSRLMEEKKSLQGSVNRLQEEIKQFRSQETMEGFSPFSVLPEELVLLIFSFLEMKEVCNARLTCVRWASLGNDDSLLQLIISKKAIPPAQAHMPTIVERDWKWVYLSQNRVMMQKDQDVMDGVGSARLSSGARYDGEWKEGKENGYGVKFWPIKVEIISKQTDVQSGLTSGEPAKKDNPAPSKHMIEYDRYEGMWKDGWEHGVGKYTWADGSVYRGDWVEGKRSGQGVYAWPNGSTYVGEWKDGHQEGWGIYRWPSGSLYMGGWRGGNQDGWGVKSWGDSSSYEGEWFEGQKHGKGTYSWIDGRSYKGNWQAGKKNGTGRYLWSDGTSYDGEWEAGLRHGHGIMRYTDGSVYDGMWWKDRRIKAGDEHTMAEGDKLLYEKPYDHYFCEPDDLWERKYRADIDAQAKERRAELDESKRRRREIKKHCLEIQKRFKHC